MELKVQGITVQGKGTKIVSSPQTRFNQSLNTQRHQIAGPGETSWQVYGGPISTDGDIGVTGDAHGHGAGILRRRP